MKTGIAKLPLHYGKAPAWLMQRMIKLAREITIFVVSEFGSEEMLRRLSNPFWFQAFGCVLGFDWHSSGLTTTTCGALKEGIKGLEKDLGLFVTGGKGRISRNTPLEIEEYGERMAIPETCHLIYASKMAAKVDSSGLQDGYRLYHHCFIFTVNGSWGVIQQGMNGITRLARRYHWLSSELKDFVREPHLGICSRYKEPHVLNMVAAESEAVRSITTDISKERPERLVLEIKRLQNLELPSYHQVLIRDLNPDRLYKTFLKTYEEKPEDFEHLLGMKGVGPKTIRALSLISELVYGVAPSFQDPARFSFAHGGKDGHPYPIDKAQYDKSIEILKSAVIHAKIGNREKVEAIKRLLLL